jgi:hypothetical protein
MRRACARSILANGLVFALTAAVASRLMVYAVGYAAQLMLGGDGSMVEAFCRSDCVWYVSVMRDGYAAAPFDTYEANWAFFPLLPLMAHVVWTLGSVSPQLSLLITGNLAFLMAVPVIYCYGRKQFGEAFARALVVITCFNPYSVYFSAGYSESLFLLTTALALLLWQHERFILAGLAATAASATRIVGAFLVLPFAITALLGGVLPGLWKLRERDLRMLNGILLAPAGLALFMTFLYFKTGDALATIHAQVVGWGRVPGNPARVLFQAWNTAYDMERYFVVITAIGLILAAYLAIRRRFSDAAFMAGGILMPLSTMTWSMPRFIFGLLPTYVALTLLARDLRLPTLLIVAIFAMLDALVVVAWVAGPGVLLL